MPWVLWLWLSSLRRGFVLSLLSGQFQIAVGQVISKLRPVGEDRHHASVGADGVHADPGLDRSTAPGGINEADGHMLALVDFSAEEISHSGKFCSGLRGAFCPGGGNIGLRIERAFLFKAQQSYLRQVCFGDFLCTVFDHGASGKAVQRHFHIRLTGGKPDIAYKNVCQRDGSASAALGRQVVWAASAFGSEPQAPFSEIVSGCRTRLAVKPHRNCFSRTGPSPDMNGPVALQDRMAADDVWQTDFCPGEKKRYKEKCGE